MKQVAVLSFFLLAGYASASLPAQFQRCDRRLGPGFNQCLGQAIFQAIKYLSHAPIPEYGFPIFEPLYIGYWSMNIEGIGDAKYSDYQVHGYSGIQQIPQVHFDPASNTLDIRLNFPRLEYTFDIILDAIIGGELTNGTGLGRILTVDEDYQVKIVLSQKLGQDGQSHYKVRNIHVEFNRLEDVKRYDFFTFEGTHTPQQLTDLFNAHKQEFLQHTNREYGLQWAITIKRWLDDFFPKVTVAELWG